MFYKKIKSLILVIIILLMLTNCENNDKDKLYYAIENNSLQGVREVLTSDTNFDFEKLGHQQFSAFRENEQRALAFAFDGFGTDEAVIMELLNSGKVRASSDDDFTYLDFAVCNGYSLEIIEALIEHGADVNAGEVPALESYMSFVNPNLVDAKERGEILVHNSAEINSDLFMAVMKNEWKYRYAADVLKWLEEQKVDIKADKSLIAAVKGDEKTLLKIVKQNDKKLSKEVLIFASATCSAKTLEEISKEGYDFNISDSNGWNPLHIAALYNNVEVIQFLLDEGLDVNSAISENLPDKYDAVTMAVIGAKSENLQYLISNGGCISSDTWRLCCNEGSAESIQCLLNEGYEPTESDYYCAYTALDEEIFNMAVEKKFPCNVRYDKSDFDDYPVNEVSTERMEVLIDNGAKISQETLRHAIEMREYDLVKEILRKNEKLSREIALADAVSIGDFEIVKILAKEGVDVNKKIKYYDEVTTVMDIAAEKPSEDILNYLMVADIG